MVFGALLLTGASLTASVLVMQVAVLPLMFRYSKTVQRKMVFSNCINYPKNLDFDNPASCNIMGGRNFSIEFESKVDNCPIKIGIWHLVPCTVLRELLSTTSESTLCDRLHRELQNTRNTIVLYCHGNSNHRGSPHRLQMYKVFQDLNYHVITFDYRGYGDSTHIRPTERGVVEDALKVYAWLMDVVDKEKRPMVVLWGHSLGTAIASNLVANIEELCRSNDYKCLPAPDALVLEAPFNNLLEEIEKHPFSKLVSWLPYYKRSFIKPFSSSDEFSFTTDEYLAKVPGLPVLMLHSKGDRIVPYELAVKLHDCVARSRANGGAPVQFHVFDRGHNDLCEAPDLPVVVRDFLQVVKERECVKKRGINKI
ncbi:lysophosphatidylserine lipase ABHD12-like isoform X1 [Colias croceus]|uniref:lysophosphatidylserine lipase ABHD12-like isoform X1 n=1 Tax=Colias crocea TaxID=72248 RepID=UPI001E27E1ED|nr:lysophosphatidylserine lipase ABHD12-like isoform X1 [Colias croceus]